VREREGDEETEPGGLGRKSKACSRSVLSRRSYSTGVDCTYTTGPYDDWFEVRRIHSSPNPIDVSPVLLPIAASPPPTSRPPHRLRFQRSNRSTPRPTPSCYPPVHPAKSNPTRHSTRFSCRTPTEGSGRYMRSRWWTEWRSGRSSGVGGSTGLRRGWGCEGGWRRAVDSRGLP
jgi:hypothetical protein